LLFDLRPTFPQSFVDLIS
jgi:hypothetical protein